MSNIYHFKKGTALVNRLANSSCFRPLAFLSYARPIQQPIGHYELFVYTIGVHIGSFPRNLTIRGCILGNDVYPVDFTSMDITKCTVSRRILPGEKVSVAIANDDELKRVMSRPDELVPGTIVQFEEGDVVHLPKDVQIHLGDDTNTVQLMAARSEAQTDGIETTIKEQTEEDVRYEICAATQMKLTPHILKDWVDYHRRIGVDMVYIMDNNSPEDLGNMFLGRKDVEVIYWPFQRSQIQAFSYFTHLSRSRCEWMILFDADEYVMFGIGKNGELADKYPLKRFVNRMKGRGRPNYDFLEFRFLIMGSGGVVEIPKEPLPEVYFYRSNREDSRHGKGILRCDLEWKTHGLHWAKQLNRNTIGYRTKQNFNMFPVEEDDDASIVHYRFRSFREILVKSKALGGNMVHFERRPMVANESKEAKPGLKFLQKDESMRYTHFRDVWRQVTEKSSLHKKTIVRVVGNERCVMDCENEVCADVKCSSKFGY